MSPLYLTVAIIALGFLIAIHEAGHMLVAKWCGMRVKRFSVGFGPLLAKFERGGTVYQIAAIPFGGFVEIAGFMPEEEHEDPSDPSLYVNQPVWKRMAVIFAGPATNYIFACLTMAILYASLGQPRAAPKYDLKVDGVTKEKAADRAGIKKGDIITHIDGFRLDNMRQLKQLLLLSVQSYRYEPNAARRKDLLQLELDVERGGKIILVTHRIDEKKRRLGVELTDKQKRIHVVQLRAPPQAKGLRAGDVLITAGGRTLKNAADVREHIGYLAQGFRWVRGGPTAVEFWVKRGKKTIKRQVRPHPANAHVGVRIGIEAEWVHQGVGTGIVKGLFWPIEQTIMAFAGLYTVVAGKSKGEVSAAGPVGIVVYVESQLKKGVGGAITIVAFVSMLLGLFNLLPIPALDGGRLFFRTIELVSGRRLSFEKETMIHRIGFLILLGLVLILTVNDVRNCMGW